MLIIPLGKKGSTGIPIITIFICVACLLVFLFAHNGKDQLALAFYPDKLDPLKMFTSVFAHADIFHLLGNLFFFYSFSRTIETQISAKGYLLAFFLFVAVTNLAYAYTAQQPIPTIGLSGVVWGYMGIFLFRYAKDDITCFIWFIWFARNFQVPVLIFILAFFAFDVLAYKSADRGPVNYIAHFSGFAAGVMFRILFWRVFTTEQPEPKRRPAAAVARK